MSFSTDNESSDHMLLVSEGDTVTAAYKDSTLPYPYTAIGELDIVATSIIFSLDDSHDRSADNTDTASLKLNVGSIQWVQAAYPSTGTGVVRVTDPDMNLNTEKLDIFPDKIIPRLFSKSCRRTKSDYYFISQINRNIHHLL